MSFRGKGLEWPEPPGDDVADRAGELFALPAAAAAFLALLRLLVFLSCSFSD